jgi:DNA-binding PadR family transcriptional regulator
VSIRQGLLALLDEGPMHGYGLRREFERRTGAVWPLNVGQVYTTLARLERDGLVTRGDELDAAQASYGLTQSGRAAVEEWFATPVGEGSRPRDELAIKLAMAVTVPGIDVARVVQTQRTHTVRRLQEYTRLKAGVADGRPDDLAWSLVLESLIFDAEAEVRWLDHCEARVARAAVRPAASREGDAAPAAEPSRRRATR